MKTQYDAVIKIFENIKSIDPDIYETFNIKAKQPFINIYSVFDSFKLYKILKKYMKINKDLEYYGYHVGNCISFVFFYDMLYDTYKIIYKMNKNTLYDLIKFDILTEANN